MYRCDPLLGFDHVSKEGNTCTGAYPVTSETFTRCQTVSGGLDVTLLTDREMEVLLLLPEGETDRLLARRLGISERTLRAHVTNIKRKLGYRSRMEATLAADRYRRGTSHPR
ncbi:LuxR C-terminal-related transcriptional regulator [Streptomyces sp. NPDC000594]|uniref:response regulator transcription factor n=1 Tax=Streptomyces sp. NPDC000594 TaxID=3154261 RepID=UPI00331A5CE7